MNEIEKIIAPARHSLQHVPLTESMVIGGTIGKLRRALEEASNGMNYWKGEAAAEKERADEWFSKANRLASYLMDAEAREQNLFETIRAEMKYWSGNPGAYAVYRLECILNEFNQKERQDNEES